MFWNVLAIPALLMSVMLFPVMSLSSRRIFPLLGLYTPVRRLKIVVFPAPFGPIKPYNCSFLIVISNSLTARRPPKEIP